MVELLIYKSFDDMLDNCKDAHGFFKNFEDRYYYKLEWLKYQSEYFFNKSTEIFVYFHDDVIVGILPFCIKQRKYHFLKVNTFSGISSIYNPYIRFYIEEKYKSSVLKRFVSDVNKNFKNIDLIEFSPLSSDEKKFLVNMTSERIEAENFHKNLTTIINSTWVGLYSELSKNFRHAIRKSYKKTVKENTLRAHLYSSQYIDEAMDHYYQVYNDSWKGDEEFPKFHRDFAKKLAEENKLRLFILYLDKSLDEKKNSIDEHPLFINKLPKSDSPNPVAVLFSIVDNNITYQAKTAYKGSYNNLGLGNVLYAISFKHMIDVDKVKIMDHQIGDEAFKYKWKAEDNEKYYAVEIFGRLTFKNSLYRILKKFIKILKNNKEG